MSSFTREQLKDMFDFFDEDGSGTIPASELRNALLKLAIPPDVVDMKVKVRNEITEVLRSVGKDALSLLFAVRYITPSSSFPGIIIGHFCVFCAYHNHKFSGNYC